MHLNQHLNKYANWHFKQYLANILYFIQNYNQSNLSYVTEKLCVGVFVWVYDVCVLMVK